MQVPLLYGRGSLRVSLPDDAEITVIRKPEMPTLADPAVAVADDLKVSVDSGGKESRSLEQIAAGASSSCIAICDITRPVPNHLFLRPMIESQRDEVIFIRTKGSVLAFNGEDGTLLWRRYVGNSLAHSPTD